MNQNYINQNKVIPSPHSHNCIGCYNCPKIECNCTCHNHKNKICIGGQNKYINENEKNNDDDIGNINFNSNYDKNICQNINTKIINNSEMPLPNINIDLSKNLNDLSNYYRDIYTKTKLELDVEKEKSNSLEEYKMKNKTKIKNLLKDKTILLEKIKNLSEQLDKVITMLQEMTAQKQSQEEEIAELSQKLISTENQISDLNQKNKILLQEKNQNFEEIKIDYQTKLEQYNIKINNLNQIIEQKNKENYLKYGKP